MLAACLCAQTGAANRAAVSVPSATEQEIIATDQASPYPTPQGIYAAPPTFVLIPRSPRAHPGSIWLRSTENGLHIFGRIQASDENFRWPRQKSEVLTSDHVEVWLAASPDVTMPQIGWGNQFGANELASARDCAKLLTDINNGSAAQIAACERWYNQQILYRHFLRRLFVRQWLIAGADPTGQPHFFEDFASTAWAGLSSSFFSEDLPVALQPKSDDGFSAETGAEDRLETGHDAAGNAIQSAQRVGYHFHVFIPYSAFPPAQQLKLADLYLMVDVFSAAPAERKMGDYSSTSVVREWGKPETFNHLQLAAPRTFSITPCQDKPEQQDLYDKSYAAWFWPTMPGKDAELRSTFALMNPAQGYLYEPGSVSPQADNATYFWKQLATGATVCGPMLAWRSGSSIKRAAFSVDETHFNSKTLPDGWALLRSGPFTTTLSPFGSGQCGACLTMSFDVFSISPQGEFAPALTLDESMSGENGSPDATDLSITPDWNAITIFREFEAGDPQSAGKTDQGSSWSSTTFCLDGHAYKQCAESKHAKPPDPPTFKELRGDN